MYEIIFKVILGGIALAIVKRLFGGSKASSKNPFEKDCRRAPQPIVRDKQARKNVYKQMFSPEVVPKDLDAIVIGSGIGGLSCAAIMAKVGQKVLVLEQLNKAGGCTHTFKEKGVEFDVGIHYIGNMLKENMSKTFVEQITEGQVQWEPLDDAFDVVLIGDPPNQRRYEILSGPNKVKALKNHFPNEAQAIDEFLEMCKKCSTHYVLFTLLIRFFPRPVARIIAKLGLLNWMKWHKLSTQTLQDYLENLTTNQELRDVLGYCFGDYGTLPEDGCVGMHGFLWKHFYDNAAYPVGGASEFAMNIVPVIENAGGKVLTSANVTRILCRDGKAVGVIVNHANSEVAMTAPAIISNAGVINTFRKLLPAEVAEKCSIMPIISKMKHGIGGVSVFVGLEGTKEDLELKAQNIWAFSGNDINKICKDFFQLPVDKVPDADIPLMFVSFPSAKDPTWDERFPGKSSLAIVTLANYSWFEKWKNQAVKKRHDEYNEIKNIIGENLIQQVLKIYPQLKDKIGEVTVGSPLSNDHYIASPRGEIYGLDHTKYRFSAEVISELRPDTEVPGLYITGQDTMTCGFAGALHGGLFCASKVLGRNVIKDLMGLHSRLTNKSKTT